MKNTIRIFSVLFLALILSSCTHRLVGTWTIEKYETTKPGQQGVVLNNIGSMTFMKNGSGFNNINYSIFDVVTSDNSAFIWSTTDKYVTIAGDSSSFSKSWIYIQNKPNHQIWKSTDGNDKVHILELSR